MTYTSVKTITIGNMNDNAYAYQIYQILAVTCRKRGLKGNTMAQRTNTNGQKNTTKQNSRARQNDYEHSAVIHIAGTLKEVYVGKKYAYAKIECYNNGDYYTLFRVAFPLDYDFPEDGDNIDVYAKITSYKNEYSFTACEDGDIEPF